MHTGKSVQLTAALTLFIFLLVACGPGTATPPETTGVQVVNITESDNVTGQIIQTKVYNQCESGSSLKTQIQFSESSSQSAQKELSLSAGASGEVGVSVGAKVSLEASVTQKYANVNTTEKGYQETINIEVPARTQQEYTMIWRETRREGTIEYREGGETKYADYSYRIGLELASSTVRDLSCWETATPSPVPSIPTQTLAPPVATPIPGSLSDGCLSSAFWQIDSTDLNTLNSISVRTNGCYDTGSLGVFPDQNGVLHILDGRKPSQLSSGIYAPLKSDSVIEFRVRVSFIYLVNQGTPVYINFAVAPFDEPMNTKNTARFKLQVEDAVNSPLIYFVLADVGENNGAKLESQHYEYGRTYTVRLELAGSVMRVFINDVRLNQFLSIPTGSKVFYIGYNLPPYAGVDVEVTNIKIDGELK